MVVSKYITLFALLLASAAHGQPGSYMRDVGIDSITVTGLKPLRETGIQRTELDSTLLRENITNSLADILSYGSGIFIKSHGRATLSTASFRGTAPSHTQVMWNGMKINSPMLGMTDLSMIPSFFIDKAELYHGASSTGMTGGGLGGAVVLSTEPPAGKPFGLRYIQGIGSYSTFDEFLHLTYSGKRWKGSTRVSYSTSDNDFKYTNHYKKNYITDGNNQITGFTRPVERNRNGQFRDLNILQELYYTSGDGSRFALSAWYTDSKRGLSVLDVNYRDRDDCSEKQFENTFRSSLSWKKILHRFTLSADAGYTYSDLHYRDMFDIGGSTTLRERSRSYLNTFHANAALDYHISERLILTGKLTADQHMLRSVGKKEEIPVRRDSVVVIGNDLARFEISAFIAIRYRPLDRVAISATLRGDIYKGNTSPLIPALFAEYRIWEAAGLDLKASAARNYRYPTLNDLYFRPGGNPELRPEKGYTYDAGLGIKRHIGQADAELSAVWYGSRIKDWIVWVREKSYTTPMNVRTVNSYGVEIKGSLDTPLGRDGRMILRGNYTLANAINHGDPVNWADESIGKQLVYIPRHSASLTALASFRSWELLWKWNYYSERFTTSSNDTTTPLGRLSPYFMNDVSLRKGLTTRYGGIGLRLSVNNLFDEEYVSELSRPMAGRNFNISIEFTPRFGKGAK